MSVGRRPILLLLLLLVVTAGWPAALLL